MSESSILNEQYYAKVLEDLKNLELQAVEGY